MNTNSPVLRSIGALFVAVCAFTLGGCASIVHGGSRSIVLSSQPSGAKFSISKAGSSEVVDSGVTPMTVSLDPKRGYFKGQTYNLKFEFLGYKTSEIAIRPKLTGWYFGNILLGGLIGMVVVDPLTGSMWNLSPDKIDQTLTSDQAAIIRNKTGFMVVLISQISDSERARMVKIN